jgi:LysR family glycine cleavage system transcriptional activator
MANRLPPLNALRAFEVAARHLSFSRAAEELCVTPAAISHQIRSLEDYLGVELFRRLNPGLELTQVARAVLPKVREGFDCLAEAVKRVQEHDAETTLTVWSAPSLAAKWLVTRLHRFTDRNPGIDLRIAANIHMVDPQSSITLADELHRHSVDVAITLGGYEYPGCRVDRLFAVSVVPLCSPRLLKGKHPLRQPQHLRHHTLIHDDTGYEGRPDWRSWLEAAGVEGVDSSHGSHFNHAALALAAAVDGHGVVLSLEPLAADDLAAGRLVIPFNLRLPLQQSYQIVSLESVANEPKVSVFRNWLLQEAKQQQSIQPASDLKNGGRPRNAGASLTAKAIGVEHTGTAGAA